MAALDLLWSRHRQGWRRLLSSKILRELELRSGFDLHAITTSRIQNTIPPGRTPDCERCQDLCCLGVENVVSLRLRDIAILIELGRTDLIAKKKPRFSPAMLRARPRLQELVSSQLWRTLPVLRQDGEHRLCAALGPDLRCTLYPNWPLSCERFPYTLVGRRRLVWGTRCPSWTDDANATERSDALADAAVDTYNERIRDAVLLTHARAELDRLAIGPWLTSEDEDPFEPA